MSRLHHVTEEEIAAAQLRLVTDRNLRRTSPAVVTAIAQMVVGDVLELPGADDRTAIRAPESASSIPSSDNPAVAAEAQRLLDVISSETHQAGRLASLLVEALQPSEEARLALAQQRIQSESGTSGNVAQKIADWEALLADMVRVLGPDDPRTLQARASLARMLRARADEVRPAGGTHRAEEIPGNADPKVS
ncbi:MULTISPECIES: hypothetical protein [Amycolatopsis]|uniref:Uncharacterized protein n=1 Tax=Amycolatopsis dendrobii TaxID=2760662 RepID=A0A7W3ZB91_9PSEU|nr:MULTISPECIES: hypothetical protein [Amycolatopsis]MBB1155040.1 hypothetical protein [Amycolatopsis dendrobii]UKD56152.1 hypothetical protein L3Q65_05390 [Amycolatopsis sp. FU40]